MPESQRNVSEQDPDTRDDQSRVNLDSDAVVEQLQPELDDTTPLISLRGFVAVR